MANPEHLELITRSVAAWNLRMRTGGSPAELQEAMLDNAKLQAAFLPSANLRGAKLRMTNLLRANLREANLRSADLRGANLREANLEGADLQEADLLGAKLFRTNLTSANVGNAYIMSSQFTDKVDGTATMVDFVDLRDCIGVTQDQIDVMHGDNGVVLPPNLSRPEHWTVIDLPRNHPNYPEQQDKGASIALPPDMPQAPAKAAVRLVGTQLEIEDLPPPDRSVLEDIFIDMKEAVEDLKGQGNLNNISPLLAKGIDRFLKRADVESIGELDQVRFGVATAALRLQFEPERLHLNKVAQDKIGHIEAVLYQADLITARLPEWVEFLEEEEDTRAVFLAQQEDAEAILEHAAESLQAAPEQFDVSLFERVREYLDDKTIEGYLASKDLLIAIAHKTFVLARDLLKDTVSESRKVAIKGIAGALVSQLGAGLLKLAGLLPKQLDWLAKWMEYLPTLL